MNEDKCPEVSFKYFLPDHTTEVFLHINAAKMYALLYDIDQHCRSLIKYRSDASKDAVDLAQELRTMIRDEINIDIIK